MALTDGTQKARHATDALTIEEAFHASASLSVCEKVSEASSWCPPSRVFVRGFRSVVDAWRAPLLARCAEGGRRPA
eukprot:4706619-Pleurochrysis_carterae.AAC.4